MEAGYVMYEVRAFVWVTDLDGDYQAILSYHRTAAEAEEAAHTWERFYPVRAFVVEAK
jgi:hypothetical protein